MARPKKPEPLPTDLTLSRWESTSSCLTGAGEIGRTRAAREIISVLTNERPSRRGVGSIDYCQGYEACLKTLEQLFSGRIRREDEEPMPKDDPEVSATLAWEN